MQHLNCQVSGGYLLMFLRILFTKWLEGNVFLSFLISFSLNMLQRGMERLTQSNIQLANMRRSLWLTGRTTHKEATMAAAALGPPSTTAAVVTTDPASSMRSAKTRANMALHRERITMKLLLSLSPEQKRT